MAQTAVAAAEPHHPPGQTPSNFLRKLFGRSNGGSQCPAEAPPGAQASSTTPEYDLVSEHVDDDVSWKPEMPRRASRKVVPGLPRAQTFKRQQSEKRANLAPVQPTPDERRTVSVDRRVNQPRTASQPASQQRSFPRASAPQLLDNACEQQSTPYAHTDWGEEFPRNGLANISDTCHSETRPLTMQQTDAGPDGLDTRSITTSQYDDMIHEELEQKWILNLSMHFRDKSKREKFFVTYRENQAIWRRVTVSLDYRNAPDNSLELDLSATRFQRDKSAKIYEAIRESLQDIQFYDSVTNLKLQTTDGRLHVHVVEDTNEIINYPPIRQVEHLGCRRIRESQIEFDAHMSGFVYRVRVAGETLIKKEIPGPETVDEFLYEINALHSLRHSADIIRFYGVVVDDQDECVKGLLISYADQGALVDVLYDNRQDSDLGTPWEVRERWARQIVQGLAEIHECGFVQGDFTLSNIVVDEHGDAKIIDINRRGCPVGWEPPEASPLIESGQRLSMYIGVKSDLFQLGMVLWALATQEDEPEIHGRPLRIQAELPIPNWFRRVVDICLSEDPRRRVQASSLLSHFPAATISDERALELPTAISVDDGETLQEYFVETYNADGHARVKTVKSPGEWAYLNLGIPPSHSQDPYYHTRGRSPPSPLSSHYGHFDSIYKDRGLANWAKATEMPHSYSDAGLEDTDESGVQYGAASTTSADASAVLLEMPDAMEALSAPRSGVLTPESLAVEHHVHVMEDGARTPTNKPKTEIRAAALAPDLVPLPPSPELQDFDARDSVLAAHRLQHVPEDLTQLEQPTAIEPLHVFVQHAEASPEVVDLIVEEAEGPMEQGSQEQRGVSEVTGKQQTLNQSQDGIEGSVALGGTQEGVYESRLDWDSGLTAPEVRPDNSNGVPCDETDTPTNPQPSVCGLAEEGRERLALPQDVDAGKDAAPSASTAPALPEDGLDLSVKANNGGEKEYSELEGIGAAHSAAEEQHKWEASLRDDDIDIRAAASQSSVATARTTTTTTTTDEMSYEQAL